MFSFRKLNLTPRFNFFRTLNKNPQSLIINHKSVRGFTLIELLVVIIILGILAGLTISILNPLAQIKKSQDATRQHDLKQLATALDSYYNDKNYYPQDLATLVGAKNIQAIPNDPVSSSWKNYSYLEEQGNTPQWNVLFGKLAFPAASSFSCPLEKMKDSGGQTCVPLNYSDLGYNYCIISGSVNCNIITTMTITPLPVHIPSAVDTPTPTSTQYCYCSEARFLLDATNGCLAVQPAGGDTSSYANRYCGIDSPSHNCIEPCTR